jgi:hypothetical protein
MDRAVGLTAGTSRSRGGQGPLGSVDPDDMLDTENDSAHIGKADREGSARSSFITN